MNINVNLDFRTIEYLHRNLAGINFTLAVYNKNEVREKLSEHIGIEDEDTWAEVVSIAEARLGKEHQLTSLARRLQYTDMVVERIEPDTE